MSIKSNTPVILFGDFIAAYGVLRALGPLDIPIYLVSQESNQSLCRYSRYVKKNIVLSPSDDHYLEKLLSWGEAFVGKEAVLIIAGADEPLDVLPKYLQDLPLGWKATFPKASVVRVVREKALTYMVAQKIGIPIPKSHSIKNNEDFKAFKGNMPSWRFPLLLKAEKSHDFLRHYKTKGILFDKFSDLCDVEDIVQKYSRYDGDFVLQEYIPGPEKNLWNFIGIYDKESNPSLFFLNRKRRSSAQFSSCTVMESFFCEELITYSNALLKEIGYIGYANPEYKMDTRDGSLCLMEINGRVSMSNSHALRCGINLPLAMYNNALEIPVQAMMNYPEELKSKKILWWFPLGELKFIASSLKENRFSLSDYLRELKVDGYIVEPFFWKDPLPGIFLLLKTFAGIIGRGFCSIRERLFPRKAKL